MAYYWRARPTQGRSVERVISCADCGVQWCELPHSGVPTTRCGCTRKRRRPRQDAKRCPRCGVTKPASDFHRQYRKTEVILASYCKGCSKAKREEWAASHPERVAEFRRRNMVRQASRNTEWHRGYRRSNPARYLFYNARARAKRFNLPFSITIADVIVPERCPVLGTPIRVSDGAPSWDSPSLDRIIPELGYVPGNIAVISNRANTIKQDATADEILAVGRWLKAIADREAAA